MATNKGLLAAFADVVTKIVATIGGALAAVGQRIVSIGSRLRIHGHCRQRSATFWRRRWDHARHCGGRSAGVAAWVRFTASGKAAAQFLFDVFKPTIDIIGETLGGIGDAL
jgi:hypothetical protein